MVATIGQPHSNVPRLSSLAPESSEVWEVETVGQSLSVDGSEGDHIFRSKPPRSHIADLHVKPVVPGFQDDELSTLGE